MGSINKDHPGSTTQKTLENYILESTRSIFFALPFSIISKTPTVGGAFLFLLFGGYEFTKNCRNLTKVKAVSSRFCSRFSIDDPGRISIQRLGPNELIVEINLVILLGYKGDGWVVI